MSDGLTALSPPVPPTGQFGQAVRQLRLARGWVQRDLAAHSGLSTAEISRIEAGYRENPTVATIRGLACALNVTTVLLMERAGWLEPF